MIEVELPNGTIVEFPAGTAEAVMMNAIRSHMSPEPSAPAAAPEAQPEMGGLNDMGMPQSEPAPQHNKLSTRDLLPAPQTVLDLLGSGGLGAAGMMAGAPAGPAGSIALGGAGAAAGKRIARDVGSLFGLKGSEEYPAASESALDAAAGGAGPAASAVARPLARAVTGVTKGAAREVQAAHQIKSTMKGMVDQIERGKRVLASNPATSADKKKFADEIADIVQMADAMAGKVPDAAINRTIKEIAQRSGKLPQDAGKLGALIMGIAHGDVTAAAALFGAGFGASKVRMAAARRLLRNERSVEWLVERASGGITPGSLLTSLSSLAAIKGIAPELKRDIRTLQQGETEGLRGDRDALEEMMRLK